MVNMLRPRGTAQKLRRQQLEEPHPHRHHPKCPATRRVLSLTGKHCNLISFRDNKQIALCANLSVSDTDALVGGTSDTVMSIGAVCHLSVLMTLSLLLLSICFDAAFHVVFLDPTSLVCSRNSSPHSGTCDFMNCARSPCPRP